MFTESPEFICILLSAAHFGPCVVVRCYVVDSTGYVPEFQLENVCLTEAVVEADPSTLEYQTLTAEAPVVNTKPSEPPVTGESPSQ